MHVHHSCPSIPWRYDGPCPGLLWGLRRLPTDQLSQAGLCPDSYAVQHDAFKHAVWRIRRLWAWHFHQVRDRWKVVQSQEVAGHDKVEGDCSQRIFVRWRLRPKCQPRARDASGDGQLLLSLRQLWSHYQHQKDQRNVSASSRKPVSRAADIAGFYMTSLKLSWDFTFMIYKSSSKLLFIQIFAPNGFLVFYAFGWGGIYMTGERAVMLVKTVTYFGEFGYLNSSCIKTSIILRR